MTEYEHDYLAPANAADRPYEGRTFDQARAEIAERLRRRTPEDAKAVEDILAGRYVTEAGPDESERYALYRLCECDRCAGTGKTVIGTVDGSIVPGSEGRCSVCRGEGRTRDLIATCGTPEALGVAIVTLAREGEWEGCPIGILDTLGEPGEKWLVRPWLPSARNISDAGRTLAKARNRT